jgi:hypothetical protein
MAIVRRPSTSSLVVLALIAACGGKVLTNQGSQGGGSGQTGTGSGTFGSGTGSSSTGTGPGTGSTGTGFTVTGAGGDVSGGPVCGMVTCPRDWSCCSPSCGACTPPGSACLDTTCGSAGAFGQGGAFIGAGGNGVGCAPPPPSKPAFVASEIISDLESGPVVTGIVPGGGGWFSYKDSEPGSTLTPDPANFMTESPGLRGTMRAVHVIGKGFMPPLSATNWGGGVGMALSPNGPTDLSEFTGITFLAKSGVIGIGGVSDINVQIGTTDTDPTYCTCLATANCYNTHSFLLRSVPQGETKYTVRFVDLSQPNFGPHIPFNPTQVLTIIFSSNGPAPSFDFWIDEIRVSK